MSIIVVGAGGHAAVVLDILASMGARIAGVVDADPLLRGTLVLGHRVIGPDAELPAIRADGVDEAFVAIGDNALRRRLIGHVTALGYRLVGAVHPAAVVSRHAIIGPGVAIMAGAVVNARARLEAGTVVNTGATIDHDCWLGECVHVAPGAHLAGGVRCGAEAFVGVGASAISRVTIGERAVVGAGAAVVTDVPAGALVLGVPARQHERREQP